MIAVDAAMHDASVVRQLHDALKWNLPHRRLARVGGPAADLEPHTHASAGTRVGSARWLESSHIELRLWWPKLSGLARAAARPDRVAARTPLQAR
jgi:hypothetical protein